MLYDIHVFLHAWKWWVLILCLAPLFLYGRVLLRVLFAEPGTVGARPLVKAPPVPPVRRLPPRPMPPAPPAPTPKTPMPEAGRQEVLPGSLDAGITGHQQRGAAKTVKLPAVPPKSTDGSSPTDVSPLPPASPSAASALTARADKPKTTSSPPAEKTPIADDADAAAMEGLFGGIKDEPTAPIGETRTGSVRRKASRLEELGFHHSIPSDVQPGTPPAAPAPPSAPAEPAPRSNTAELTSILERIDKFLAEDPPAKPTEATTEQATPPADKPAATTTPALVPGKSPPAAPVPSATPATDQTDPAKKTPPLWARSDVLDEDADKAKKDAPKSDSDKPADPGQQRLF